MTTIPRRRVGTSDLEISQLALGSWHTYDRIDFSDAVKLLRHAVDAGITLFDLGVYAMPGMPAVHTDVIFSAMVRAAGLGRSDYQVSSKLWLQGLAMAPEAGFRPQLENAFFRAGIDHAELAILGDFHGAEVSLEAIADAMGELTDAGLLTEWGVNNWSATNVRNLRVLCADKGVKGPQIAQLKYSVARRSIPEGEPFGALFAEGFSMEASDIFEGGYLAGRKDLSREVGRDPGSIRETIIDSVDAFTAAAASVGTTPARLSMAFSLVHPANATTLFGATRIAQVDDAIAAIDLAASLGAAAIHEVVAPFWADKGIVDPEGP